MRITALAGGVGGARFLRGLLHGMATGMVPQGDVSVIGNTGDDIWVHGLRVCPDLDTVMYTLGGGISEERGWGREAETFTAKDELAEYGVEPTWFGLGDRDIATHLVRTQLLNSGYALSDVTAALCTRWQPGVTLLPMSDQRAETHVIVDDPSGACDDLGNPMQIAIHFQEWWIRWRASIPAHGFTVIGMEDARPAPGVLEAIESADLILFPPSNPVVSIGTILQVSGIREAITRATAPVIGVSPIIGGHPVRGMADACLRAIGIETTAEAVARHYGSDLLDGWLVDTSDSDIVSVVESLGIGCVAVPLLMSDLDATAAMAARAIDLANLTRA